MSGVSVSDHALVRYLERVYSMDVETVRREILSYQTEVAILMCGNGRYPIGDRFHAVVENNVIVTVVGYGDKT